MRKIKYYVWVAPRKSSSVNLSTRVAFKVGLQLVEPIRQSQKILTLRIAPSSLISLNETLARSRIWRIVNVFALSLGYRIELSAPSDELEKIKII